MKPLVLSKNSWHYKLVTRVTTYGRYGIKGDICEYVRCLLGSILVISVITVLSIAVLDPFVHMILGIGFSVWMGTWFFTDLGILGLIITFVAGLVFVIRWLVEAFERRSYNRRKERLYGEPKPDGFIKSAYKSWKGKYCLKIEFAEDNHDDNIRAGQ